jgi:hypothetical protein
MVVIFKPHILHALGVDGGDVINEVEGTSVAPTISSRVLRNVDVRWWRFLVSSAHTSGYNWARPWVSTS